MRLTKGEIIGVSSSGGHLTELIKAVPTDYENNVVLVTSKNGRTIKSLQGRSHFFIIDPHKSVLKFVICFLQSLYVYLKLRPKVIISTGAGIAIPMILIGRALNTKIIFIETGARVIKPSRTARFVYGLSDLFIVQYQSLTRHFPKSKVGRL